MRNKKANIFSIVYTPLTALISRNWEIIIFYQIISMCRYAQSCAFISVIELPRIPAYYPKNYKTHKEMMNKYNEKQIGDPV